MLFYHICDINIIKYDFRMPYVQLILAIWRFYIFLFVFASASIHPLFNCGGLLRNPVNQVNIKIETFNLNVDILSSVVSTV